MAVHINIEKLIERCREKKLAHAILLETNDYDKCMNDLLELVKTIMCPDEYSIYCEKECNICSLITGNNLPSFEILETEERTIKKAQILDLKTKFGAKSIYTDYSVYVIKEAEKLTPSSSNTMLKFLEEPEGQVIAFFMTNNEERILDTIKSRMGRIKVKYDTENIYEKLHISEEIFKSYLEILLEYVKIVETNPELAIVKNKKIVLENIKERTEINLFFDIYFKIYYGMIDYLLKEKEIPKEFSQFNFLLNNDVKELIRKLNVIQETIQKLQYNPNLELLLDRFVLEMRTKNE